MNDNKIVYKLRALFSLENAVWRFCKQIDIHFMNEQFIFGFGLFSHFVEV